MTPQQTPPHTVKTSGIPTPDGRFPVEITGRLRRRRNPHIDLAAIDAQAKAANKKAADEKAAAQYAADLEDEGLRGFFMRPLVAKEISRDEKLAIVDEHVADFENEALEKAGRLKSLAESELKTILNGHFLSTDYPDILRSVRSKKFSELQAAREAADQAADQAAEEALEDGLKDPGGPIPTEGGNAQEKPSEDPAPPIVPDPPKAKKSPAKKAAKKAAKSNHK